MSARAPEQLPRVHSVGIHQNRIGLWTWSYILGNRIVWGPDYRTERSAHKGLGEELKERGLAPPELPGLRKGEGA